MAGKHFELSFVQETPGYGEKRLEPPSGWLNLSKDQSCRILWVLPEFSARNILNVSKMLIPFYMIYIFYIFLILMPISRLNFAAVFSCQGLGITGIAGSLGQVNVAWECLGHFFTNPGTFTAIYCNYCLIVWIIARISMSIFSANIWTTLGLGICHAHQHWPPLPTNPLDEWSLKMSGNSLEIMVPWGFPPCRRLWQAVTNRLRSRSEAWGPGTPATNGDRPVQWLTL